MRIYIQKVNSTVTSESPLFNARTQLQKGNCDHIFRLDDIWTELNVEVELHHVLKLSISTLCSLLKQSVCEATLTSDSVPYYFFKIQFFSCYWKKLTLIFCIDFKIPPITFEILNGLYPNEWAYRPHVCLGIPLVFSVFIFAGSSWILTFD